MRSPSKRFNPSSRMKCLVPLALLILLLVLVAVLIMVLLVTLQAVIP